MINNERFVSGIRRRSWAEIDLERAEQNYLALKENISPKCKICCVIKANAYGHGAVPMAKLYEKLGADYLAVSNIEEALQLRENRIALPILILGYTPEECASILAEHKITQCVYSYDYGTRLADAAKRAGVQLKIHIKLDTGMGRIGFLYRKNGADELNQVIEICQRKEFFPEGIFTHFATADDPSEEGEEFTEEQRLLFEQSVEYLAGQGLTFDIRHCANSAATLKNSAPSFNMVRLGIVLYGLASQLPGATELSPVMTLKSVISHIKELEVGESVGYGRRFLAAERRRIATVPIGYGDGFWRANRRTCGGMLVKGEYAPIVGNVCMDQTMLDVTDLPCNVGDEVTVFGADERCSAEAIAKRNETISYEIVCSLNQRVPRCFLKNGSIEEWQDPIYHSDLDM
ncbi:MAG: alanine racemase [Clostridia bacterium]|nr:alanine racemase [Clostridia bacterium]